MRLCENIGVMKQRLLHVRHSLDQSTICWVANRKISQHWFSTMLSDVHARVGTGDMMLVRTELGNNFYYQLLYADIAYYLFSFILPLILLAAFNTRLIVTYRRVSWLLIRPNVSRLCSAKNHNHIAH